MQVRLQPVPGVSEAAWHEDQGLLWDGSRSFLSAPFNVGGRRLARRNARKPGSLELFVPGLTRHACTQLATRRGEVLGGQLWALSHRSQIPAANCKNLVAVTPSPCPSPALPSSRS